jgi:hypothetical protein
MRLTAETSIHACITRTAAPMLDESSAEGFADDGYVVVEMQHKCSLGAAEPEKVQSNLRTCSGTAAANSGSGCRSD